MDKILYMLVIIWIKNSSKQVMCEYCPVHTDNNNVIHRGFNCPPALRLVGKSDFYCCRNTSAGHHYCCTDRRRSLNYSHRTYGEEAFMIYWPFLALGLLIAGFVIILPYTRPKHAEMKQYTSID